MPQPHLSVVVPTLNEEACIAAFIERMGAELSVRVPAWEIVVVDDGSRDGTCGIVEAHARRDSRVRLVAGAHRGKGAAVRRGLLAATGEWRMMADADLAMPPDNLQRFLTATARTPPPDVVIGSREAPGAQRVGESWLRHAIGRVFNLVVRVCAVPGVQDTQCGYKVLSADAVSRIVPQLTLDGFAFDVELLSVARREGLLIQEVGIVWHGRRDSRVAVGRGASAFLDVVRIGMRGRRRR